MRDRVQIRKTGDRKWTVKVPTIGFGPGENADSRIRRESSVLALTETVWQSSDGVAPHPRWNATTPVEREI